MDIELSGEYHSDCNMLIKKVVELESSIVQMKIQIIKEIREEIADKACNQWWVDNFLEEKAEELLNNAT